MPTIDQLLVELPSSGLSTAAFARSHGLPPWKLYNALQKRTRGLGGRTKKPTLIPVRVKNPRRESESAFELLLVGGHRVVIPEDFDPSALRRLMGALAGC